MMPAAVAAFLLALGCVPTMINGPDGPMAAVWVCPPPEPPPQREEPPAPKPEERGA